MRAVADKNSERGMRGCEGSAGAGATEGTNWLMIH